MGDCSVGRFARYLDNRRSKGHQKAHWARDEDEKNTTDHDQGIQVEYSDYEGGEEEDAGN